MRGHNQENWENEQAKRLHSNFKLKVTFLLKNISQFHSTCLSFPNCYMGLATQSYFAKVLSSLIYEPLKNAPSSSDERRCRCQTWVYALSQTRHGHAVWSAWRTAPDRRRLSSAENVGMAGAKITGDAYTGMNSCYRNQEPPDEREVQRESLQ